MAAAWLPPRQTPSAAKSHEGQRRTKLPCRQIFLSQAYSKLSSRKKLVHGSQQCWPGESYTTPEDTGRGKEHWKLEEMEQPVRKAFKHYGNANAPWPQRTHGSEDFREAASSKSEGIVRRSPPDEWQSNVEREKRRISLAARGPWKGLNQQGDACFTEYQGCTSPGDQLQPKWSTWDDFTEVSSHRLLWI